VDAILKSENKRPLGTVDECHQARHHFLPSRISDLIRMAAEGAISHARVKVVICKERSKEVGVERHSLDEMIEACTTTNY